MIQIKDVFGFSNYTIDELGIVTNKKTGKIKSTYKIRQIELYIDGKKYKRSLPLLLINTFIDSNIKLVESIGYIDGNPDNIVLSNLYIINEEKYLSTIEENVFQHPVYSHIYATGAGKVFSTKLAETRGIDPPVLLELVGCLNRNGYLEIGTDIKRTGYKKHRAIFECVTQKSIPEGLTINHIDGDKVNNRIENLECITRSENSLHMHHVLYKGRLNTGETNKSNILTEQEAICIKRCAILRLQVPIDISKKVSTQTLYDIAKGKTWKYLPSTLEELDELSKK